MYETVVRDGRVFDWDPIPRLVWNQKNKYGKQAAAEWEYAPHQTLPVRGNLWRIDWNGRGDTVIGPHRDGFILE
jgi:hypothetical protein